MGVWSERLLDRDGWMHDVTILTKRYPPLIVCVHFSLTLSVVLHKSNFTSIRFVLALNVEPLQAPYDLNA